MPTAALQHDKTRERFERTLARGRLASTYLFTGLSGIGKRAFAQELTAALLCHDTPENQLHWCGRCESCRLLDAGNHPDVLEVSRPKDKTRLPLELFIGDKDHRNQTGLCHEIALKPYLGRRRVAIIDDADLLTTESANSLLKTLEEPPPRSLLILIGTSVSKQLPTIRSRCQMVRFSPLDQATVERVLIEKGLLEEGEDPKLLATQSGGSVGSALAARDPQAQAFHETLLSQLSTGRFDPVRLSSEAVAYSSNGVTEASDKRRRISGMLSATIEFYRRSLTPANQPPAVEPTTALACLEACLGAEAALGRNANQGVLVQYWLTNLWRVHATRNSGE